MEEVLSQKEVIDISAQYFGACYGLLITKSYYRERWFVFLTVFLTLMAVLCLVAFSVTVSPLLRTVLSGSIILESLCAVYMVWFVLWLDGEYKKLAGVSLKTKRTVLTKNGYR